MEFDKSRIYSAVNADELKSGDKVIVADQLSVLKQRVQEGKENSAIVLQRINGEDWGRRFGLTMSDFALAYLVERAENCTKCEKFKTGYCVDGWDVDAQKIFRCENYKSKTEQKAEQSCEDCKKAYTDYPCVANFYHDATGRACKNFEAEPHYRPFKDTDELVKVWDAKIGTPKWGTDGDLTMPHIWVRRKTDLKNCGHLVTDFNCVGVTVQGQGYAMSGLFASFEFLDGSPCGVEE